MKKYSLAYFMGVLFLLLLSFSDGYSQSCCTDQHANSLNDQWRSCAPSTDPAGNVNRHWIRYDFGAAYELLTSTFWNYNELGEIDMGFQTIDIYHSSDGLTWTDWGDFIATQASGLNTYTGENGPNFTGLTTQYLLLSASSNFGDAVCSGIGEFKIQVKNCTQLAPNANMSNVSINGGSDGTIELYVTGAVFPVTYAWADGNTNSLRTALAVGTYDVTITDANGCILAATIPISEPAPFTPPAVEDQYEKPINLTPIETESFAGFQDSPIPTTSRSNPTFISMTVYPNPIQASATIELKVAKQELVSLVIRDINGRTLQKICDKTRVEAGTQVIQFSAARLHSGTYLIELQTDTQTTQQKIIVSK